MKSFCRRTAYFLAAWLMVLACSALPLFAAEEAAPDPPTTPTGLVFRWVNFLLVAGGLAFLLLKYGGTYFRNRAQTISQAIREAGEARAAAEREVAEADKRLAHLQSEIQELRSAAQREAAAEAERIRNLARTEAAKIAAVAKAEIAAAERAGQQELRAIAARVATERAATLMGQRINAGNQAALFHSFVAKLQRSAS